MKLTSAYRRYGDLGLFEVAGERDLAASCLFWRTLALQVNRDKCACILIRDLASDKVQPYEIMLIEKAMAESGLSRSLPIAIVDEDATQECNNRFGELVVQNRGWPLIRVFLKESEAWAWLDTFSTPDVLPGPKAGGGPKRP